MWNSNSLIAWLLARGGLYREDVRPPRGGRAPGWDAGLVVARRQRCSPDAGELEARPEDVEHVKVRGKRGSVDSPQEAGGGLPMARAAARARLSE
jgi:hypothetical protein